MNPSDLMATARGLAEIDPRRPSQANLRRRSEVVTKVWREAEDSPGFPLVHFIAKSDLGACAAENIAAA